MTYSKAIEGLMQVILHLDVMTQISSGDDELRYRELRDYAEDALKLLRERQWRKFEFREPDAEEKEAYPECTKVLIGGPDDGDEILVSNGKYVWKDEFYVDDTCYLDSHADLEECWWMPLPEPPREEEA